MNNPIKISNGTNNLFTITLKESAKFQLVSSEKNNQSKAGICNCSAKRIEEAVEKDPVTVFNIFADKANRCNVCGERTGTYCSH